METKERRRECPHKMAGSPTSNVITKKIPDSSEMWTSTGQRALELAQGCVEQRLLGPTSDCLAQEVWGRPQECACVHVPHVPEWCC